MAPTAPTGTLALNVVLGVSSVGDKSVDSLARFDTPDEVNSFLNVFAARGYGQLDTARGYSPHAPGSSEPRLGAVAAGDKFAIDTKVISRSPGDHTKSKILKEIDISLEALKVKQINIEYLHAPDRSTPFEEACEAMDQAHREGKIKHWGLSNYTAEEVQKFVDICEERGFVKPAVYQGHYNAIIRGGENDLFPVLRKYKIAFYAYGPASGGIFAGSHKQVKEGGRFDQKHAIGNMYSNYYLKDSIITAAENAVAVATKHGIGGHAAALRWAIYHSILKRELGDSVIIGASSPEQLNSNLDTIEQGPLPDGVVAAFEGIYEQISDEEKVSYHF